MCPSNATSASNCSFSPLITPRCFESSSAAGVQCIQGIQCSTSTIDHVPTLILLFLPGYIDTPPPGCTEFDLRLTNTSFSSQDVYVVYEGNVEICINGTYVAICDLGWDNVEAQLACNIEGYGAPFFRKFDTHAMLCRAVEIRIFCCIFRWYCCWWAESNCSNWC